MRVRLAIAVSVLLVAVAAVTLTFPVVPSTAQTGRPNPARFYIKAAHLDWDFYTTDQKDKLARYNDLVFIGGDLDNTRRITAEIRVGAESQGNAGIKILRY